PTHRPATDPAPLPVPTPFRSVYSLAAPADTSGNASGSFSYTPAGEGTYSFYTLATDKAGNAESPPSSADVQVTVLYDTSAPVTTDKAPRAEHHHHANLPPRPT